MKIQLTWAGDRKDSEIVIWETCFLTHVTSAKPLDTGRQAGQRRSPPFFRLGNPGGNKRATKDNDAASGRPETLPRTSDSKSCASSLLNSERRLLLIKKTLKSGLGVFRGWPKKTRKYTFPREQTAHSELIARGSQPAQRTRSRGSGLAPRNRPKPQGSLRWPPVSTASYPLERKRGPQVPSQYLLKHRKGTAPSQTVFGENTQSKHAAQRRKKWSETVPRNPGPAGVEGRELPSNLRRRRGPAPRVT